MVIVMKYSRKLTPDEMSVLGPDWEVRLNGIVDKAVSNIATSKRTDSTPARVLALISVCEPMLVQDITDAYNAVYGANSLSFNYARSIVSQLTATGALKRVGHGFYMRVR